METLDRVCQKILFIRSIRGSWKTLKDVQRTLFEILFTSPSSESLSRELLSQRATFLSFSHASNSAEFSRNDAAF